LYLHQNSLKNIRLSDLALSLKQYGLFALPNPELIVCDINFIRHEVQEGRTKEELFYKNQQRRNIYQLFCLLGRPLPAYQPLLSHNIIARTGEIKPILLDKSGGSILSRYYVQGREVLVSGCKLIEEITRYRQGDPAKVETTAYKGGLGFDYERPNYLYEDQLHPQYRSIPWADNLGYLLSEELARLTNIPLLEPLPYGAKGLVIITGDDDQAYLEKYDEQLKAIDGLPITYFLHPLTRHTPETLAKLPANVEIGVHPDALETPCAYDSLCAEQTSFVRILSGKPVRTVRNHGFLNDGYWGHLKPWEENGLELDVNIPGVDGTALNGSFLPFRVRRADGTWSPHYSLLTAFGDGIVFALGMTDRQAARKIRSLASQIENSNPGILVFNFHPQNIDHTRLMHRAVVKLARRRGWHCMGLESYLDWLKMLDTLSVISTNDGIVIRSSIPTTIEGLVLKYPHSKDKWQRMQLPPWSESIAVQKP
jgi:hypothetical protein